MEMKWLGVLSRARGLFGANLKIEFNTLSVSFGPAAPAAAAATPASATVICHNIEWENISAVCEDVASDVRDEPALSNVRLGLDPTPYDLFRIFFPYDFLASIVAATNSKPELARNPVSEGEMLKFLGLWLAMSQTPLADRRDYWGAQDEPLLQRPNFSKYMSLGRFEALLRNFRLSEFSSDDLKVKNSNYLYNFLLFMHF